MANQFLALSLFIMLLSFFIILNAMSNFEESRYERVVDSISIAFSESEVNQDVQANTEESNDQSYNDGDTLERLQKLFEAHITGVVVRKDRLGTMMHLRMPVDEFERQILKGKGGQSGGQGIDLSKTLISMLVEADSMPYYMEILLNVPDAPARLQNTKPKQMLDKAVRSALYARILEEAGLPRTLVTAGVNEGPDDTIDLFFKHYEPFSPFARAKEE